MRIQAVATALFILIAVQSVAKDDICKEVTDEVIKKHLEFDSFKVVSRREVHGLCELLIDTDNRLLPYYGTRDFLISGEMYENGISLAESKLYELKKTAISSAIKEADECVAFVYEPPKIKTQSALYMFTDPLCPYCSKAGVDIKALADRLGFRVKVLFFNVHGERGRVKCIEAICRNTSDPSFNLEAYNGQEWKKNAPDRKFECTKGGELLDKTEKLCEKLGVDSVPFFFVDNGNYVSGAMIDEVAKMFDSLK